MYALAAYRPAMTAYAAVMVVSFVLAFGVAIVLGAYASLFAP